MKTLGRFNRIGGASRHSRPAALRARRQGFTLIELLMVIVVIVILSSAGIPALKGIGKSNRTAAAHRQILDDVAFARLQAINQRTTVYMVFVSTNVQQKINLEKNVPNNADQIRALTNLLGGQYNSYALIAARTAGDQPGRGRPRYLTPWRTLPDGILFAPFKFNYATPDQRLQQFDDRRRSLEYSDGIPFPTAESPLRLNQFYVPYLAFDSQGRLTSRRDEVIALAEGTISVAYGGALAGIAKPALDVPKELKDDPGIRDPYTYNTNLFRFVRVNWLTGRAKVEGLDIQ